MTIDNIMMAIPYVLLVLTIYLGIRIMLKLYDIMLKLYDIEDLIEITNKRITNLWECQEYQIREEKKQ